MPNPAKNGNLRSVRVPQDVWVAAQIKEQERGETVTDVILRALKRYAR